MARIVKSGLIQISIPKSEGDGTIAEIKEAIIQKHIPFIEDAGKQGVQILCLQEILTHPISVPVRMPSGMPQQNQFPDLP